MFRFNIMDTIRAFRRRRELASRPLSARAIGARETARMAAEAARIKAEADEAAARAAAVEIVNLCVAAGVSHLAPDLVKAGSVDAARATIDAELQRRQAKAQLRARLVAEVRAEKRKRELADGAEDSPLAAAAGDPYGWADAYAKVSPGARRAPAAGEG